MAFLPVISAVAGLAGSGISALGSLQAGEAQSQSSAYAAQVARNNAVIAEQNATRAEQAGNIAAENKSLQGADTAGKIKVAQAASGVDVNTGSAKNVQESQRVQSRLDSATVLSNAELQAYGYRVAATSDEAQARLDDAAAKQAPIGAAFGAAGGLLSGISSVGSKWAQFGGGGGLGAGTSGDTG